METQKKFDGKNIYWCKKDYDWKYSETDEVIEKNYQLQYHCQGEGVDFVIDLTQEQLDTIDKMTGGDSIQDICPDNPMIIKMVSNRQKRESEIAGLMFGDGLSRENAERVIDGLEIIDD